MNRQDRWNSNDSDQLAPARGVICGLIIGAMLWTIVIGVILSFWLLHHFHGV